ncbi:GNAT family N-acetyltransferase [Bacillus sp. ISL-7]|uniref:GNAT family N-acetyltransferase n=1 Tax=Bacillus sp. ISL-7 TaxID=2819136 RepID=UPI001BEB1AA1|nr:GNAT family protein [Bacillus sp. ISL-7]MBT2738382.1 GNAT family N-acetyltransferase [Bacillus sp. ISL-7]
MIVGKKIILRALKRKDTELVLKWINDPKLKYLTGTLYPVSDVEHEKWFENKLLEKTNKLFGIEEQLSSQLIGLIGFNNIDFINRTTEISVYIGEENQRGKGLGTDALRTLIKFAFDELNLHRVSLVVFSYNTNAIKAYEKIGFKTEGILKESLYKAGRYHDKILMAVVNNKENSLLGE